MGLSNKFKRSLVMAMALTTAMSTVNAISLPVGSMPITVPSSSMLSSIATTMPTPLSGDTSTKPNFPSFIGGESTTITRGDYFSPSAGVIATDGYGNDITASMIIEGKVDTNKAGRYMITYSVTNDKGLTTKQLRYITVSESDNPTITGVTDVTVKKGSFLSILAGVRAYDVDGNNITRSIRVTGYYYTDIVGKHELIYTATDSKGRTASFVKTVTVVE